jgi:chromosome segregation ATPase
VDLTWKKDQEKRRNEDKNLVRQQQAETRALQTEKSQVEIDISIAESRIKDLKGQQEVASQQIKEILTDKRKVDKENMELEHKLQGRGVTEADQKRLQFEAEREQITRLNLSIQFKNEQAEKMMEQLKAEEALARSELDAQINFEQEMEQLTEDADIAEKKRAENREELLRLQIKYSQLQTANAKHKDELERVSAANEKLVKENRELDEKNTKLD